MPCIRPYQETDLPQIEALIKQNLQEVNSRVYPPAVITFMIARYEEAVAKNIFRDFSCFLVAEAEHKKTILGCAGWKLADTGPQIAYLSSMFIAISNQHHGIGRQLLQAIMQDAVNHKQKKIVCAASLNAIEFYEHLGFQKVGRRDARLYGMVMDMSRDLSEYKELKVESQFK